MFYFNNFRCKYLQYILEFPPTKKVVYFDCLKNNLICCYFRIHTFSVVNYHGPGLKEQVTGIHQAESLELVEKRDRNPGFLTSQYMGSTL